MYFVCYDFIFLIFFCKIALRLKGLYSETRLAERRIKLGCHGDFFLRGGTGYNKTHDTHPHGVDMIN